MSKAAQNLTPWLRRMFCAEPPISRVRLSHVASTGRGSTHIEDRVIPSPRPETLSPEELARELVDAARSHAEAWGGRQTYQVTAYAAAELEPVGSMSFAVVLEAQLPTDATSEPQDVRSFGAMSSRMAADFARLQLQSQSALGSTFVGLLERLESQVVKRDETIERLHSKLEAIETQRLELAEQRAEFREQKSEAEDDAQTKQALLALVMQSAPALLSMLDRWAKKQGKGKGEKKRLKKPSPRKAIAGKAAHATRIQ